MPARARVVHRPGPPQAMERRGWPVPVPDPPVVIGFEGAGIVEGVGDEVRGLRCGDRAACAIPPPGSYAEVRSHRASTLLHLPDGLDDRIAAALPMKGMTAQYLLHRNCAVQPRDTIPVHAAAGGMALIPCRRARAPGATVAGTVLTGEKAEAVRAAGCEYPAVRGEQDFVSVVRDVTGGEGCAVVCGATGRDTPQRSLDARRPMGVCAACRHVSGPPDPVDVIGDPGRRGSLSITRPAIMHHVATRSAPRVPVRGDRKRGSPTPISTTSVRRGTRTRRMRRSDRARHPARQYRSPDPAGFGSPACAGCRAGNALGC